MAASIALKKKRKEEEERIWRLLEMAIRSVEASAKRELAGEVITEEGWNMRLRRGL